MGQGPAAERRNHAGGAAGKNRQPAAARLKGGGMFDYWLDAVVKGWVLIATLFTKQETNPFMQFIVAPALAVEGWGLSVRLLPVYLGVPGIDDGKLMLLRGVLALTAAAAWGAAADRAVGMLA